MPKAVDVMRRKDSEGRGDVITIGAEATALEAARLMNERRIGALVVADNKGKLLGIFTERDVLTRIVAAQKAPEKTHVGDVMTRDVVSCGPEALLTHLRSVMRERRIRHIPVVEGGRVVGMVSIGDINAAEAQEMSETINYLEQYIHVP